MLTLIVDKVPQIVGFALTGYLKNGMFYHLNLVLVVLTIVMVVVMVLVVRMVLKLLLKLNKVCRKFMLIEDKALGFLVLDTGLLVVLEFNELLNPDCSDFLTSCCTGGVENMLGRCLIVSDILIISISG